MYPQATSEHRAVSPTPTQTDREAVLITGGAGFVGSNLTKALLKKGFAVYVVDNLITGSARNILPSLSYDHFFFYNLDITHSRFVRDFSAVPFRYIFHLACPTGVPNIKLLGEEMLLTSSVGTRNVLEIARMTGAKIIYASSAEVYGNPEIAPQDESYCGNVDPRGPRSAYEEGKRFGESMLTMYVDKYNVDGDIVRFFNIYGPGMRIDDQRVIPNFMRAVRDDKELVVYGDGQQKRTFLFIDDLIEALTVMMTEANQGEVYNIGSTSQITIRQLAEKVIELTKHSKGISSIPHFIEDHTQRLPAIERITGLGWQPKTPLEQGLTAMIAAYQLG